jgi:glc operon protein GlcG
MKTPYAILLATLVTAAQGANVIGQQSLTLEGAQKVLASAVDYARSNKAPGAAIAVVDSGGHVVLVQRLDGTFPAGADISVGKARTAVMFRRPTAAIENTINKGRSAMIPVAAVTDFTPLQGGIPLIADGQVVGGIGVSGAASAQQDEEIALAGAKVFETGAPQGKLQREDAQLVEAQKVALAFTAGDTGATLLATGQYRVNASRRDAPGQAEIHTRDTDIFYVLEGKAEVVTGGELLEPRELAPGEIRGYGLRGGMTQQLAPGDVLTIPQGLPHWFKRVSPPFRYFVVKSVTAP